MEWSERAPATFALRGSDGLGGYRALLPQEPQYGSIELGRYRLGAGVPAALEELEFRLRNAVCEVPGKVARRQEVILGADDESRRGDAVELRGPVEIDDSVASADRNGDRREDDERLGIGRFER